MKKIVNTAAVTLGWWGCLLGAESGLPWIGPGAVLVHLVWHTRQSTDQRHTTTFLATVALFGFLFDTLLSALGIVSYASPAPIPWISPLWMVVLWPNFATSLSAGLDFLQGKVILPSLIGLFGGPLAYWGGERLGALSFGDTNTLVWVAAEWAIAMPIMTSLTPVDSSLSDNETKGAIA